MTEQKKVEEKTEIQEITEDQLKQIIQDGLKEIVPALKEELKNELKDEVKTEKGEEDEEDKGDPEEVKSFLDALVKNDLSALEKLESKAVNSTTTYFGYTIPTTLANAILEKKDKISKMRKLAFVFEMTGPFQLPTEGTGVTTYWVDENEEITESNPTVSRKTLDDYYMATRVLMPRKMLNQSAYSLQEYIARLSSRSIKNAEETAFVAGDGDSKPLGLRQMTGENEVAQASTSFDYDDMVNLFYDGLAEQYRSEGVFMTSTEGIKLLRKLEDEQGHKIFDIKDQTVFGRPVWESADIPSTLGSGGDETEIWFFDPSYYWIKDGDKMGMEVDKIISKLQVELVLYQAIDGTFVLPEAAGKLSGVK